MFQDGPSFAANYLFINKFSFLGFVFCKIEFLSSFWFFFGFLYRSSVGLRWVLRLKFILPVLPVLIQHCLNRVLLYFTFNVVLVNIFSMKARREEHWIEICSDWHRFSDASWATATVSIPFWIAIRPYFLHLFVLKVLYSFFDMFDYPFFWLVGSLTALEVLFGFFFDFIVDFIVFLKIDAISLYHL